MHPNNPVLQAINAPRERIRDGQGRIQALRKLLGDTIYRPESEAYVSSRQAMQRAINPTRAQIAQRRIGLLDVGEDGRVGWQRTLAGMREGVGSFIDERQEAARSFREKRKERNEALAKRNEAAQEKHITDAIESRTEDHAFEALMSGEATDHETALNMGRKKAEAEIAEASEPGLMSRAASAITGIPDALAERAEAKSAAQRVARGMAQAGDEELLAQYHADDETLGPPAARPKQKTQAVSASASPLAAVRKPLASSARGNPNKDAWLVMANAAAKFMSPDNAAREAIEAASSGLLSLSQAEQDRKAEAAQGEREFQQDIAKIALESQLDGGNNREREADLREAVQKASLDAKDSADPLSGMSEGTIALAAIGHRVTSLKDLESVSRPARNVLVDAQVAMGQYLASKQGQTTKAEDGDAAALAAAQQHYIKTAEDRGMTENEARSVLAPIWGRNGNDILAKELHEYVANGGDSR